MFDKKDVEQSLDSKNGIVAGAVELTDDISEAITAGVSNTIQVVSTSSLAQRPSQEELIAHADALAAKMGASTPEVPVVPQIIDDKNRFQGGVEIKPLPG